MGDKEIQGHDVNSTSRMKDNGCKAERGTVGDVTGLSSQPKKTRAWPCTDVKFLLLNHI